MRIIAVGRLRNGPEAELFARYAARMKPRLELTELPEAKGAPMEVKRREGAALLAALPAQAVAVALDLGGIHPDTAGLADLVERWAGTSRPVCFLIGGAEGLDGAVIQRADHVLSLGAIEITADEYLERLDAAVMLDVTL